MTKSNFLKGSFYLILSHVFIIGTGYIIHFWIARELGPYQYGLYGIILGVMGVANIVLVRGIPQALSKYSAEATTTLSSLFRKALKIQFVLSLSITVIYFLSAPLLSRRLGDPSLSIFFRFSAITLPFYGLYSLLLGALNGTQLFGRQSLTSILYAFTKVGTAIFLARLFGLMGAIGGFIIAPFVGSLVGLLFLFKKFKAWGTFSTVQFSSLFKFGFSLSIIYLAQHLHMNVDLFFVKILIPNAESTGYYTAATTVARIPYFTISAVGLTLLPLTSALGKDLDKHRLSSLINTATRIVLLVLVGGLALSIPELEKVISLLYSSLYQPAILPLAILLVALSLLAIFLLAANIAAGLGDPHTPTWIALASILLSGGLCFLLIPHFQLVGAAIATLASALLSVLAIGAYLQQKVSLPTPARILRFLVSGTLVYFLNTFLKVNFLLLLPKLFLLGGLYLALLYLLGELKKQDFLFIYKLKNP